MVRDGRVRCVRNVVVKSVGRVQILHNATLQYCSTISTLLLPENYHSLEPLGQQDGPLRRY